MRALVLLVICGCLPASSSDGSRDELVMNAVPDGDTLHLYTEWSTHGDRERARHLTISLSTGECLLVGSEHDFVEPPPLPLSPIDHDLVAGPHAIVHPVAGAIELVFDDGRPRTRYPVSEGTHVRWVIDSTLILVERHALVDLETGRTLLVDAPDWARRFAIAQGRIFSVRDGQLLVTDLHLREQRDLDPELTLYDVAGGTYGVQHVWQHALGDNVGWTIARTVHAVAIDGFRDVAPYATPAEWRTLGVIDFAVTSDGATYWRIDGRPYQSWSGRLVPIPVDVGTIVVADARIVVLSNPEDRAVWVSVGGSQLRPYSFNTCSYAGG